MSQIRNRHFTHMNELCHTRIQALYVGFGTHLGKWKNIKFSILYAIEAITTGLDINQLRGVDQVHM